MSHRMILFVSAALFCLLTICFPVLSAPTESDPDFTRVLSLGSQTIDAATGEITLSPEFKGYACQFDVIGGTTLVLDLNMEIRTATGTWAPYVSDIPSAGGITGVSTTRRIFHPNGIGTAAWPNTAASIPRAFRIFIDTGNANAYSFNLDCGGIH